MKYVFDFRALSEVGVFRDLVSCRPVGATRFNITVTSILMPLSKLICGTSHCVTNNGLRKIYRFNHESVDGLYTLWPHPFIICRVQNYIHLCRPVHTITIVNYVVQKGKKLKCYSIDISLSKSKTGIIYSILFTDKYI